MVKRMAVLMAWLAVGLLLACNVRAADDPAKSDQNRDRDASANTTSGNLNSHDAGFLNAISRGNVAEVKLAKLAEQNASSDRVKDYARTLIKDHQANEDQLKTLAKDKNLSLATDVDDKQQATYDRLSKLNGADFDKAYIKDMISDHENDIDLAKEFSKHGQDNDVKSFADQLTPKLQEHLRMAKDVNDQLTGTGTSNR